MFRIDDTFLCPLDFVFVRTLMFFVFFSVAVPPPLCVTIYRNAYVAVCVYTVTTPSLVVVVFFFSGLT